MSLDALRLAFSVNVETASERLLLLALANDARRTSMLVFPSRERLHQVTRLDPKTITASVKKLELAGLLQATGERKGRTGRIPVYRLVLPALPSVNAPKNGRIRSLRKSGKSGSIGAGEIAPLFPGNASVFPSGNTIKNGGQNQVLDLEPGMNPSAEAGADAPIAAKDFLYGPVLQALLNQGEKRSSAGSLLGKLASVLGEEPAAAEARKAIAEQPICLRSRLAVVLKGRGRGKADDVGLWSQDYSAGVPPVREALG